MDADEMRLIVFSLCLTASFLLPPAAFRASAAAEPERIDLRIEMFAVAGLHVLTIHETLNEAPDRYSISTDLESRGLADLLISIKSRTQAQGWLSGGRVVPVSLVSDTVRNGIDRHTSAVFNRDGTASGQSSPAETVPRTPVTAAQIRGTVDELSAYYMLERQLGRNGPCAMTVPVFDGRRRYDLIFADLAPEVLRPTAGSSFAGPTKVCELTERKIAGFPVDSTRQELVDHGKIWLARLIPGEFMVPVRMEFDSELGLVRAYLAELHGRGVSLKLME